MLNFMKIFKPTAHDGGNADKKAANAPYLLVRAGEWAYEFYYLEGSAAGTWLRISTPTGLFGVTLGGNTHAYGYLLAAAQQGLTEQLRGYAAVLCVAAMSMTQDQRLTDDLTAAIDSWTQRKAKEADETAAAVTEAGDNADAALIDEAIELAETPRKERRKARKASRKAMAEELERDNGAADGK